MSDFSLLLTVLLALGLDRLLAEPRRFHPLVGFGALTVKIETHLYRDSRLVGIMALLLAILPIIAVSYLLSWLPFAWGLDIVLLYLALGGRSLWIHAEQVRLPLLEGVLLEARQQAAYLVSRDTRVLDQQGVARATVESVLENGNDAIFAALFWFALAGAPGVVLYRLANTLDAMWGYRHARYANFGWAAARLDDVLNYIPARLTAFSYALAGHFRQAIACWWRQGSGWKSPNAGPVMAAGAGSLGVLLGGPEVYQGERQYRPLLGCGRAADVEAISGAQTLIQRAVLLWIFAIFLVTLFWNAIS